MAMPSQFCGAAWGAVSVWRQPNLPRTATANTAARYREEAQVSVAPHASVLSRSSSSGCREPGGLE